MVRLYDTPVLPNNYWSGSVYVYLEEGTNEIIYAVDSMSFNRNFKVEFCKIIIALHQYLQKSLHIVENTNKTNIEYHLSDMLYIKRINSK